MERGHRKEEGCLGKGRRGQRGERLGRRNNRVDNVKRPRPCHLDNWRRHGGVVPLPSLPSCWTLPFRWKIPGPFSRRPLPQATNPCGRVSYRPSRYEKDVLVSTDRASSLFTLPGFCKRSHSIVRNEKKER